MKKTIIETIKNFGVEKELPGRGDLSERENLLKLASESAAEEKSMSDFMDMKYQIALEKYLENNPGKTEKEEGRRKTRRKKKKNNKKMKTEDLVESYLNAVVLILWCAL